MKKPSAEFSAMVERNEWHDRSEIDKFVEIIKRLSAESVWDDKGGKIPGKDYWSWAYNPDCKYIDLRFDMRDGGFVMRADEEGRISLDQLQYQWTDDEEE